MIKARHRMCLRSLVLFGMTAITPLHLAHAATQPVLPTGGSFTSGAGSIAQSGSTMTINQSSHNGVVAWNGFSVGQGGSVQFNNGSGATLNRVTGGDISVIAGKIGATGSVFLINPNGVVISPTGQVATDGSFIASSRSTTDAQFMAGGSITLSGKSAGSVQNVGSITSKGGNVALIGNGVTNSGTISSGNGVTAMVSGDDVVMQQDGSGVYVSQKATTNGDVTNSGKISAAAAHLEASNGNVYALAGNTDGIIQATGIATVNGEVTLVADNGNVSVDGNISAQNADGSGGTITANGANAVTVASTAKVSASALPSLDTSKTSDNIKRSGGTILIGTSAKGPNSLTKSMTLSDGANLHADGQNGGDGGYIETSGQSVSIGDASVSASWSQDSTGTYGNSGTWATDPYDLTIDQSAANSITSALTGGTDVTLSTDGASYYGGSVSNGSGDVNIDGNIAPSVSGAITSGLTINATNDINVNAEIEFIRHYTPACESGDCFSNTFSDVNLNYGGSLNIGSSGSIVFENYALSGQSNVITGDVINLYLNGTAYNRSNMTDASGKSGMFKWSSLTLSSSNFIAPVIPISITIENQSYVYGQGGYQSGQYVITNSSGSVIVDPNLVISIVGNGASASGSTNVGSYALTYGGASGDASKYTITGATGGTLTVTPATLTVTAGNQSSVYGAAPSLDPSKFSVSGLVNGDTVSSVALSTSAGTTTNAGTYSGSAGVVASNAQGTGLSNYNIVYNDGTMTIDKANLTITAGNQVSTYGDTPVLTGVGFTASGLKNNDSVASVNLSTTATGQSNAGNYDIVASGAQGAAGTNINNYAITYDKGTLAIGKAALTIAAGNQHSTYGDTPSLDQNDYTSSGLKNGDTITSVGLTTGATKTSGVGDYTVNAGGAQMADIDNYNVTYTSGTLTIDPASLIITAVGQHSTYGTDPVIDQGQDAYTVSGAKNGDTVTGITLSTDKTGLTDAGTYNNAITAQDAQIADINNYNVVYNSGALTVDKAPLVITIGNQHSTYGSNPTLDQNDFFSDNGLKNGNRIASVDLSTTVSGTSHAGTYTGAITGANAQGVAGTNINNYDITYVSGNLTVDKADLTITESNQTSIYGDNPVNVSGQYTLTGLKNKDTVTSTTTTTSASATSNVGSYGIVVEDAVGSGLDNYNITYVNGTYTITPAALIIAAGDQSSTYGVAPSLGDTTFTSTGLKNGDTINSVTLSTSATGASGVGHYAITASNAQIADPDNYNITYSATPGTLTIDPASLIITAGNQFSTYGNTPSLGNAAFTSTGLRNGDTVTSVSLTTSATKTSNVGSYGITASAAQGTGLANYNITYSATPGALTINPADLTITAGNQTSIYGTDVNLGSSAFTSTGLKNGDTIASVNLNTSGTAASNVGQYAITAQNAQIADSSNYTISYVDGALNITPASLIVTANNQTSTYGDDIDLGNTAFTSYGLKNGDTVSSVGLNTSASSLSNIGQYAITASNAHGTGLANYNVSYVDGAINVTKADLTLTSTDQSFVYSQAPHLGSTGFTASGLKNGDSVTGVTLTSDATDTSPTGKYAITVSDAVGNNLDNYSIYYNNATPGYVNIIAPSPKPSGYIDSAVLAVNATSEFTAPSGAPVAIASIGSNSTQSDVASSGSNDTRSKQDAVKKFMASMNCALVSASECSLSVDSMGNTSAIITGAQNGVIVVPSRSVYNGIITQ